MKKLLALLLALCCIFAVVSCGNKDDGNNDGPQEPVDTTIDRFNKMLDTSVPTKSVSTAYEKMKSVELTSTYTLTTGTNQDGKRATLFESSVQTLQEADSGYVSHIKTTNTKEWYLEGSGTYKNNRLVDKDGVDFAPVAGSLSLNLDESLFDYYEYDEENDALTIGVGYENATAVLVNLLELDEDEVFEYDVVITITAAGGRISKIEIGYMVEEHEVGDDDEIIVTISDMDVSITTEYYYNTQSITIG